MFAGRNALVFGSILLLLGATLVPGMHLKTVTASDDEPFVTLTTQIHDIQKQTRCSIQVTHQQAQEIQRMFDDLQIQLSTADTLQQTHRIFNATIDALAGYGLLPSDTSIPHLKRLATSTGHFQKLPRVLQNRQTVFQGTGNDGEMQNFFCSVAGNTSNTHAAKLAKRIAHRLYVIMDHGTGNIVLVKIATALWVVFNGISTITQSIVTQNGSHGGVCLYFGNNRYYPYPDWLHPAEGWIYTNGINGEQNLTGSFWGQTIAGGWHPQDDWYMNYTWRGVLGFTGLILYTGMDNAYFLGSALHVHVGPDRP